MPHVTAGVTATWDTTALGEITELKWIQGNGLPQSRGSTAAGSKPWSMDCGTIEVSCLSGSAISSVGQWGRKATIAIGGTARDSINTSLVVSVNFTTKAIFQTLDIGAKVNDVWRYKGTFKIVQE